MQYINHTNNSISKILFTAIFSGMFLIGLLISIGTVFTVSEKDNALVMQLGKHMYTINEPGLHFKLPFIQKVIFIKKTLLSVDLPPEEVITSDQKRLVVDAFVWFKIVNPLIFYQAMRDLTGAKLRLSSVTNSVMREVLAKESFSGIFSDRRLKLMNEIRDKVSTQSKSFGIEIIDTQIKRTDLPEANSLAIYRRMKSDRQKEAKEIRATGVERSRNLTSEADRQVNEILASAKREAKIIRGQGDAEAMHIKRQLSLKNPDFYLFYQSLIAYRDSFLQDNTILILDTTKMEFLHLFNQINQDI